MIYTKLNKIADISRANNNCIYPKYTSYIELSGTRGYIGMINKSGNINIRNAVIIPKIKINPIYFNIALQNALPRFISKYLTTINLQIDSVGEMEIAYDKEEQKNIAVVFNKLSEVIALKKKELSTLNNVIKARFVEMFGDVVLNTKNWENYTWDNVLTIKNGKNQKDVENPKGIYPICGSGGIMNYADDYITESNSVIIGRKGNINNPILMREKFWNVDTAFGLEPNTTVLNVDYLFMFCNFFDFKILNKAVTIPSLTKADLLKIIIPIPPIELQERFADFVAQVDKSKVVVQKALDEAKILFDSLMQEYFG